ncbi:hypothetical protein [Kutzneria chonburiensis]|uniref:Uncharacterized protein n=1 Tax=Kutzneria chonburiensis TaxID=1483604 RepID=A0ABV6N4A8_9PSEU|nr:hypothetical protein [Kutzneria chonburiensis]
MSEQPPPADTFPCNVVLVYPNGNELRVVITSVDELGYAVTAALNRWQREENS